MKRWKIEIELELQDDADPNKWVYKAIEELLEDGEALISGRHIEKELKNENV